MPKAEYDKQGKYFFHLAKLAGWSNSRINALLVKHFAATHWNVLTSDQKRAAINMMTRYADKNRNNQNKKLRGTIMSCVCRNGKNKAWLYETLNIQPERTLSKMDYPELVEVYKWVKSMFPGIPGKKKKEQS
jgi:hypothetical protein